MNDYVVYVHSSPDGEVFYVGCGKSGREMANKARDRSQAWHRRATTYGTVLVQLVWERLTADVAREMESWLITYGRAQGWPLVNKRTSPDYSVGKDLGEQHRRWSSPTLGAIYKAIDEQDPDERFWELIEEDWNWYPPKIRVYVEDIICSYLAKNPWVADAAVQSRKEAIAWRTDMDHYFVECDQLT